jgi:type II secretory pathway component PulF
MQNIIGKYLWGILLKNIYGEFCWRIFMGNFVGEYLWGILLENNVGAFGIDVILHKQIIKKELTNIILRILFLSFYVNYSFVSYLFFQIIFNIFKSNLKT